MTKNNSTRVATDPKGRLGLAISALQAVRGLCIEAANGRDYSGLSNVDADDMASLVGLIVDEMNDALGFE